MDPAVVWAAAAGRRHPVAAVPRPAGPKVIVVPEAFEVGRPRWRGRARGSGGLAA